MKKTIFIKNALILTATSLVLRFIGIITRIWLADKIGAEGIGLYQLTFSVYILASTFASSGISTAVTRLCADELALGSKNGTVKILKRSIEITLIIALISGFLVFFGAETIAKVFLKDTRAISALKILTFSLPFMGVSACIRGFFIARRKTAPGAATQLLEQFVRIFLLIFLIGRFSHKGLSYCCAVILFADTVAETVSCLALYVCYLFDKKKLNFLSGRPRPPFAITRRLIAIAAPITCGRYLNTFLRTAENILVPINLAKYRLSSGNALGLFGMIKGMALPILFFPSTFLNAVTTLLIPEMSRSLAQNKSFVIKSVTERTLKITALVSYIFAALFFTLGDELGILIYKSEEVGFLLKALSPIVPLMYIDSVSDGILKGLDKQNFTFLTAATDSTIRIILILIFLPLFGMKGFLGIMYFSNLLTSALHFNKLCRVSSVYIKPMKFFVLPLLSAVSSVFIMKLALKEIFMHNSLVYIILMALSSCILYLILLFCFSCVKKEDFSL